MKLALDPRGLFVDRPAAITTYTGRVIEPTNPDPDDIDIEDIAHHLSNQCRFTGATERFYSVAEHCVRVAELVPEEFRLEAILHDAAEAYIADIAKPVKLTRRFTGYRITEARLEHAVQVKFGLTVGPWHADIKAADHLMFQIEAKRLAPRGVGLYVDDVPVSYPLGCWSPRMAEAYFLDDFTHYLAARRLKESA